MPSFRVIGERVDQYPSIDGIMWRTVVFSIKNSTNWFLDFWGDYDIKAVLTRIEDEKLISNFPLSWQDITDPPDHVKLPAGHSEWVKILTIDERTKDVYIPIGERDGSIHRTAIHAGSYDFELILRCSHWSEGKPINRWHWKIPDDILVKNYNAYSSP